MEVQEATRFRHGAEPEAPTRGCKDKPGLGREPRREARSSRVPRRQAASSAKAAEGPGTAQKGARGQATSGVQEAAWWSSSSGLGWAGPKAF